MLLKAAQLSFQDPLLDVDDVEAMCASLLDQVGRRNLFNARRSSTKDDHLCRAI
jgi:hypothetical protein